MATLRDYFDTDFGRCVRLQTGYRFQATRQDGSSMSGELPFVSIWDERSNARYPAFFVPKDFALVDICMHLIDRCESLYDEAWTGLRTIGGTADWGNYDQVDSATLVDTRQIYLYVERDFDSEDRTRLLSYGASRSRVVRLREGKWGRMRSEKEKPELFISHDSRDKDAVARPLALALTQRMCPVWFDEFSLKMGDSLRENIERGLKQCTKCILVLSPNFVANGGWTKLEFETIIQREIYEKNNFLLPIWHGISKGDVYEYSPQLTNRLAANWADGVDKVVPMILRALGRV